MSGVTVVLKITTVVGRLGGSVGWAAACGSGRDPGVL